MISIMAIYVLWLREMKRFMRSKSRIIGMLIRPLFFLFMMGLGFRNMPAEFIPGNIGYIQFLVPGIVGMTILFSSMFAGMSVLWDKEFGFLKEIMVAPVNRISIVIGRIAGGTTTGLIQGIIILFISLFIGFKMPGILSILLSMVFMILISVAFIGLGLVFASKMKDIQGYSMIMGFIMMPIFLISGAMFPLRDLPAWMRFLAFLNPLTYGVDGLREVLAGVSSRPISLNLLILAGFSSVMVFLGAYFFEKSETV